MAAMMILQALLTLVVLGPVAVGALMLLRRSTISRKAGTSISGIRTTSDDKWHAGVLALSARTLEWYPILGLTATPAYRWPRPSLELSGVRASTDEPLWLLASQPDVRVASCQGNSDLGAPAEFQVMLSLDSYMALRSWAESSPPFDRRHEF